MILFYNFNSCSDVIVHIKSWHTDLPLIPFRLLFPFIVTPGQKTLKHQYFFPNDHICNIDSHFYHFRDEDAPAKIPDEDASKPEGWLDDEPEYVADPDAEKPEDW